MSDSAEKVKLEPFTFTIIVGARQQGVKFQVDLDGPMSALALAPVIAIAAWPHVTGISITRDTTGEVMVRAPFMDIITKLAPQINQVVGSTAIPIIPLATGELQDLVQKQRARQAKDQRPKR